MNRFRGGCQHHQRRRYHVAVAAVVLVVAVALLGCESLGGKKASYYSGDRVLFQRGQTFPEYSDIPPEDWEEILASPQTSVDKVYATLVVKGSTQALLEARKYLLYHPGDLDGLEALAQMLYVEKKLGLARYFAKRVIARDAKRLGMYNILGLVQVYEAETLADFRKAEGYFDRASASPNYAVVALLNLGFLYLETGALHRARATFERVMAECNNCSSALMGLGITYRRLEDYELAAQYLERALQISMPERTRYKLHYHLALILRRNPQSFGRAVSLLVEVVENLSEKDELRFRSQALLNELRLNIPEKASS